MSEEIKIIAENWDVGNSIVLIDDFCVPNDSEYKYSGYGLGKTLNYEYIEKLVEQKNLKIFYPTIPSQVETGYKTGYVFLANEGVASEILRNTKNLKQFFYSSSHQAGI